MTTREAPSKGRDEADSAFFGVIVEHELEGIVATRERDPYRPGERAWV